MFTELVQDIGYGSEAWTIKKADERDNSHLKLNISTACNALLDHKRNEDF
jgi:hypothetical protein